MAFGKSDRIKEQKDDMKSILIIEDDIVFSRMLANWLVKKNIKIEQVANIASAKKFLSRKMVNLILSDLRLPDGDGVSLLEWMKKEGYTIPFLIMTNYGQISGAVKAIKLGAIDYLCKPIHPEELYKTLFQLLDKPDRDKNQENTFYQGKSSKIKELYEYIGLVAPTDMSVLIRGASGTGKEYAAYQIHKLSDRSNKPFIAVDCGAIPKELASSEFFGHIKGAFTGANEDKKGLFNSAEGSTLFLDEIGNLPYETQMLLLRALQEKRYKPVGGKQEIAMDIRLVAATNEDLEKAIAESRFREDLFHRLNEFTIHVPLLSECKEDILPLATFFLELSNASLNKQVKDFDDEAKEAMQSYSWIGNIREMKHMIKRATLLAKGERITLKELNMPEEKGILSDEFILNDEKEEQERIIRALAKTNNNKLEAAILLHISRSTLYEKMKKYGIK